MERAGGDSGHPRRLLLRGLPDALGDAVTDEEHAHRDAQRGDGGERGFGAGHDGRDVRLRIGSRGQTQHDNECQQ